MQKDSFGGMEGEQKAPPVGCVTGAEYGPLQGSVWKRTSFMKSWRLRYFVASVPGILEYYSNSHTRKRLSTINLSEAEINPSPTKEDQFTITVKGKTIYVKVTSLEERNMWVGTLSTSKKCYLKSLSKAVKLNLNTSVTQMTKIHQEMESIKSYNVKFIAHLRQLKVQDAAEAENIENIARDLISAVEECVNVMDEYARQLETTSARADPSDEESETFYSMHDHSSEDEEDEEDFGVIPHHESPSFEDLAEQSHPNDSSGKTTTVNGKLKQWRDSMKWKKDGDGTHHSLYTTSKPFRKDVEWTPIVKTLPRQTLPSVKLPRRHNMYDAFKQFIGEDICCLLTPIEWHEPIGLLQRFCEMVEYHDLLEVAFSKKDPIQRMLFVAAFAVSSYSRTDHRFNLPFQPFLGETFEHETSHIRFISEQVNISPYITAFHMQGKGYQLLGNMEIRTKYHGNSLEISYIGSIHVVFSDNGHHYTWNRVRTTVNSMALGKPWVGYNGVMRISNYNTGDSCRCEFATTTSEPVNSTTANVTGTIQNAQGHVSHRLSGRWNSYLSSKVCNESPPTPSGKQGREKNRPQSPTSSVTSFSLPPTPPGGPGWTYIWQCTGPISSNPESYGLNPWAISLNDLPSSLERFIPPSDTRRRRDIRLFEAGRFDEVESERLRLYEKLAPMGLAPRFVSNPAAAATTPSNTPSGGLPHVSCFSTGHLSKEWQPNWFRWEVEPISRLPLWVYQDHYWPARESGDWPASLREMFQ